jgi:predicted P-loop ATPase
LATKDSRLEVAGVWIVELSELAAIRRSEVERVKSFLSTAVDAYRPPYGHRVERFPRQCIFFASSNSSEILNDSTGARRFWPVRCEKIDIDAMRAYRDQVWAEAYAAYKAGQPWWFDSADLERAAQVERDRHYERGPRYEIIAMWIQWPAKREKFRPSKDEQLKRLESLDLPWAASVAGKINATDVCIHGLGLDVKEIKPQDYTEVTNTLRHLGYESVLENCGAHRGRRYWRK